MAQPKIVITKITDLLTVFAAVFFMGVKMVFDIMVKGQAAVVALQYGNGRVVVG